MKRHLLWDIGFVFVFGKTSTKEDEEEAKKNESLVH